MEMNDGVVENAPEGTTPLQRTPPRAKFKRPRYCHKDRVSMKEESFNSVFPLVSFICLMLLPIILISLPQHKVPFQVFHSKLAMKGFRPMEVDGLVLGAQQSAITTFSFNWTGNGYGDDPSRKVKDSIVKGLISRSGMCSVQCIDKAVDLFHHLLSFGRRCGFDLIEFLSIPRTVGK